MCSVPRIAFLLLTAGIALARAATSELAFDTRSVRSGRWSDARTWADRRVPRAGDRVQIPPGHVVTYDVNSEVALRVVHVAGTLTFTRNQSTRLNVGLLKVFPGDQCDEDGFNCHEVPEAAVKAATSSATGAGLEIGTVDQPIP